MQNIISVLKIILNHSKLRLDATQKKRWLGFDFKFKMFSIKQAIFITDIFSSHVKASKQKKIEVFFSLRRFYAGGTNFINKKGLFYAKIFEFEVKT